MKKFVKILSIFFMFIFVFIISACVGDFGHTHEFGRWEITVEPTYTETGKALKTCSCGHILEQGLPTLNDKSIWELTEVVNATCIDIPTETYTSVYGKVTVVTGEKLDHEGFPENWTIVEVPTYESEGIAEKDCPECDAFESIVLPNLNNNEYWTIIDEKHTSYNEGGYVTFKSDDVEYTHYVEKLVAPYDGKTYSSFAVDAEEDGVQKNGVISIETVWSNANVTLDENGVGLGTAHPFRGENVFKMIDPETGKISITLTNYHTNEETGEQEINPEDVKTYNAYVDFNSGIVVRANSASFDYVHVYTPFEIDMPRENANASSWDKALAIEYIFEETTYTIFCYNDVVYFDVKFVDSEGNNVPANECYNSDYLYVIDNNDNLIEGFVFNGEKLVVVDGYEGTYTNDEGVLFVSGYGLATLNDVAGTYEILDETTLGVYVANEYFEVVLDGTTYSITKPMINITFNAGEFATVEAQAYNKNIVVELPTPTTLTQTFKGWFYDAEYTNPVEEEFKPLADCALYANWKPKVVINLIGVLEGDTNVLYLGSGDVIGEYLPTYGLEVEAKKIFKGWYLDDQFEVTLPEEVEVTEEDTNVSIYAKWEDLPAYYGTYKGSEIWNASYGNSGGKTLTIDENGKITGQISGEVVSYDKATQKIVWKQSSGSTTKSFYFNENLGIIAGIHNSNDISNDFYIFSRTDADGKTNAHYGIKAAKAPGEVTRGWYAHLINMTTDLGDVEIFLYNNHIYDDFTATDSLGNSLTAANVKDAKTLIVKDGAGNIIVSVASKGTSFASTNDTIDLDPYFGTYAFGDETVILDGTGEIVYGVKVGTYELAIEGSKYQFDVYFNDNTEYYELTLDDDECTLVKPMVNLTFEEGAYATVEDISVNKNIVYTLPVLEAGTHVFNGWFYDEECTQPVGANILPKTNVTLYALWKVKYVLTINYNNGDQAEQIVYSNGDLANIEVPVLKGNKFAGWYTSEDYQVGTEWTSGSVMDKDIEIFAKWEEAPAYYNTYTITRIEYNSPSTGTSYLYCYITGSTPYLYNIDPEGKGTGTSNPFNGEFEVQNYNSTTGYLELVFKSKTYIGYIDKETGIILASYNADDTLDEVFFFNPLATTKVEASNLSSSYWHKGVYRTIEYTYDGTTYSAFIMNSQVYFGATFEDQNGTKVSGVNCYSQNLLYVKDAEGNLIAKFAKGDTELELMDGNEGTYTYADGTFEIDGVKTITLNGVAGTYTKAVEDALYDLDAYVDGSYYEVTLNKADYTAVVNKPMVTITFEAGDKAEVAAQTVNKNIAITLPTPANENFVFRGWYKESTYKTLVDNNYVPTANGTLYAKWDAKVTLTVIYGNTLNDDVLYYGVGDKVAPKEPTFTNGKVFNGWYLDSEFTQAYEVGTISENTTIYCKWIDAVAMYGTYSGFNLFGSGNKNISYFSTNFTVTAEGSTSGGKAGTIEQYDEETGTFIIKTNTNTYGGFYDEESGTIAYAYGSGTTLGTDFYMLFKKKAVSGEQSANLNGSFNKLVTIKFEDGTSENYLYMNGIIYSGVTWTANSDYTPYTIGNASSFTIYSRSGDVLLTK